MSDSLAKAAGAANTIVINDKEYKLRPTDIDDLAELESDIKRRRLLIFESAKMAMSPQDRAIAIRDIISQEFSTEDMVAESETMGGVRFLLYRALKDNPGVTLEAIGELVTLENVKEVSDALGVLGGTQGSPPVEAEVAT